MTGPPESREPGREPRVAIAVLGRGQGLQRVKNGALVEALRRQLPGAVIWDVKRSRVSAWLGKLRSFHPNRETWRARYFGSAATFRANTRAFRRLVSRQGSEVDVILQVGVTFDAVSVAEGRPVVIYTDYTTPLSARLGRGFRLPFGTKEIRKLVALERTAVSGAAHVCTRSRLVQRSFVEDHGLPGNRLSVIGGGANLTAEPGVKQVGRVLFVGKEFYRKGGDLLLAAHEALRAGGMPVQLDIVTDTRFHDLSRPEVSWHDRPTDDALCALYAKASIFVMASRFETWGDALIEAMNAGCACVVADLPPLDEIVNHGESGLLFEPASAKDLTDCLHRLLASEDLVGKLGRQARYRALERFSWDVVAAGIVARIRSAMVGPP